MKLEQVRVPTAWKMSCDYVVIVGWSMKRREHKNDKKVKKALVNRDRRKEKKSAWGYKKNMAWLEVKTTQIS